MSASPRLMVRILSCAALASLSATCSSSDTVLALTIQSGMDLRTPAITISQLNVTVTPTGGSASSFQAMITPPTVLVQIDGGADAGGIDFQAIQTSFFQRLTLPDLDGP